MIKHNIHRFLTRNRKVTKINHNILINDSKIFEPDSINLAIIKKLKYSSHNKNIHIISIPSHTWLGKMIKIESKDTTLTNSPSLW